MRRLIEDYALLSDLQSAALVHRRGSIDWCCFPRFDSDACFAALLGHPEHGRWIVAPMASGASTRHYRDGSLVLETDWDTDEGRIRVIDVMPPRGAAPAIVRIVEGLAGRVTVRSELVARFGYGRIVPSLRRVDDAYVATAGPEAIALHTPVESVGENVATVSTFEVGAGERVPRPPRRTPARQLPAGLLPPGTHQQRIPTSPHLTSRINGHHGCRIYPARICAHARLLGSGDRAASTRGRLRMIISRLAAKETTT